MQKIKAILFDMDGVLIDAKEWHYMALNDALRLFGYEINRHDHSVTFDGLSTKVKLEILSKERNLPYGLHDLINRLKQKEIEKYAVLNCKPKFIHRYTMAKLKADGYKLAVCSNSISSTVSTFLEKAKIKDFFDFYLSNEDVKNHKPNPEIYSKAMKMLGLFPSQCLIFEDNQNGVKAAKAAGGYVHVVNNTQEINYENIISIINLIESNNDDFIDTDC